MSLLLAFLAALFPLVLAMIAIVAMGWPLLVDTIERIEERFAN
ncbi:hypothetical protein [Haloplanus sp. C73]